MNEERKLELLAYAKICFEHCTNPFASMHLQKKNVTTDECRDLSNLIAESVDAALYLFSDRSENIKALKEAEKAFMETQEE